MKRIPTTFTLPTEHVMDATTMIVLERQQVLFIVYVLCLFCTASSLFAVFSMWNCLALLCTWIGYSCILVFSLESSV